MDLAERPGRPFDAVLAPHHGGRAANPPWFYRWARPARVVVSQRPPMPGASDPLAPLAAREDPRAPHLGARGDPPAMVRPRHLGTQLSG